MDANTPAPIEPQAIGPFYMGFAYKYAGQIVTAEDLEGYILDRHGIQCGVQPKDDGVIITAQSIQSINTIAKEVRFSHDFMVGHVAGPGNAYQIYVRADRKPPHLEIGCSEPSGNPG